MLHKFSLVDTRARTSSCMYAYTDLSVQPCIHTYTHTHTQKVTELNRREIVWKMGKQIEYIAMHYWVVVVVVVVVYMLVYILMHVQMYNQRCMHECTYIVSDYMATTFIISTSQSVCSSSSNLFSLCECASVCVYACVSVYACMCVYLWGYTIVAVPCRVHCGRTNFLGAHLIFTKLVKLV